MLKSSFDNNLFRQNALDNLNSLDEIYPALQVINPSEWLWMIFAALILVCILLWGLFGTITLSVDTNGMILPEEKLIAVETLFSQALKDRNEKIVLLEDLYNKKKKMFENHYVTLEDLLKTKSELIAAKEELSSPNGNAYSPLTNLLSNTEMNSSNTQLDALVFADRTHGKKIVVGMNAYVLSNDISQYAHGYIVGKVISISAYPISKQLVYSYLGNMNLVDDFFMGGAPFVVKIRLQRDKSTDSGLAWTTKRGSSYRIEPGTMVSAKIIYKKSSPARLMAQR